MCFKNLEKQTHTNCKKNSEHKKYLKTKSLCRRQKRRKGQYIGIEGLRKIEGWAKEI